MNLDKNDIEFILNLLKESGKIARRYFQSKDNVVTIKQDNTPVTLADTEINSLIVSELSNKFPDIGIISEEGDWFSEDEKIFWLIDPIDGTKSFLRGKSEFTINIGLVKDKKPIYGFIFAPIIKDQKEGCFYYTDENRKAVKYDLNDNKKSYINVKHRDKRLSNILQNPIEIISSADTKSCNVNNIFADVKISNIINMSSSLKFCKISEGCVDLYMHCKNTHEWDTAAGHAIAIAAGGRVKEVDGLSLMYGKHRFLNNQFVVY